MRLWLMLLGVAQMNTIFQRGQKPSEVNENTQLLASLKTNKSILTSGYGLMRDLDHYRLKAQDKLTFDRYLDSEILILAIEGSIEFSSDSLKDTLEHPNELCLFTTGANLIFQLSNPSERSSCQFVKIAIESITKGMGFNYRSRKDLAKFEIPTRLVGPKSKESLIKIEQDAFIDLYELEANQRIDFKLNRSHHGVYFYQISGNCEIEKYQLHPTDALGAWDFEILEINSRIPSRFLAIEIPLA